MPTFEDLIQSIDHRLEQARQEIGTLEGARKALNNGARTHERASGEPRPTRRRHTRGKQNNQVMLAGQVERLLAESDGLTTAAIAKQGNARIEQVRTLLRELEAAGKARRSGERRGTRWHAITDEDRIAARVAELEQQSRPSPTNR